MTDRLAAMQDMRRSLIALLQALQNETKPRDTRMFTMKAEQIATLKIEIVKLELCIIVAGGRLF